MFCQGVEIRPILIVVWQIRCKDDIMVAKSRLEIEGHEGVKLYI